MLASIASRDQTSPASFDFPTFFITLSLDSIMTYLDDWKLCKKTFEAKAGKKPSETFFGVFRTSTGMVDAAKGLDTALKKLDSKEIDKAVATYTKTSGSYHKLLEGASKQDKGVDYKAALTELARGMDRILAAFQEAVETQ